MKVTVDKKRVPLGDEVTFTLTPASVVLDPRYVVTVFFGEGTSQRVRQTEIVHLYCATGTYTYSILVKLAEPIAPALPPIPGVKLSATPTSVRTDSLVSFRAELSHNYPNIKYRFVFADGSQTEWRDSPQTTHSYHSPGTYRAYVDIALGNSGAAKQVGGSLRQAIEVTSPPPASPTPPKDRQTAPRRTPTPTRGTPTPSPSRPTPSPVPSASPSPTASESSSPNASPLVPETPSPTPEATSSTGGGGTSSPSPTPSPTGTPTRTLDGGGSSSNWWKYLLTALILFGGYQGWKYFYAPRPTFVPHFDRGDSNVGAGKPFSIDFQMDLDPNLTGAEYTIDTQGESFIKSERGSDD